jgi:hypothetical protein
MKNIIIGNGVNIQFGGSENNNQAIMLRALKSLKSSTFPSHIIIDDPDLMLSFFGQLFHEMNDMLKGNYMTYAYTSSEKESLTDFIRRYSSWSNLKMTDIGFEDYYMIFDLVCNKIKIYNPERYHVREAIKTLFIYAIYNDGKVNNIHDNFPLAYKDFLMTFDRIFTTNYDDNIESVTGNQVYHLHGAFDTLDAIYDPNSLRNHLSDRPLEEADIDNNYTYLYCNAITSYSGYSKKFTFGMASSANDVVEKMAQEYQKNESVRIDVKSWLESSNSVLINLAESILVKKDSPELTFTETYPSSDFLSLKGDVYILGLSPNNDRHLFDGLNNNEEITSITYYYYCSSENDLIKEQLSNHTIQFMSVVDLWKSFTI